MSGTNAHIILEEAPAEEPAATVADARRCPPSPCRCPAGRLPRCAPRPTGSARTRWPGPMCPWPTSASPPPPRAPTWSTAASWPRPTATSCCPA
ncbi:hypothetical protein NKH77_44020 [Streptomyces sp. M19]